MNAFEIIKELKTLFPEDIDWDKTIPNSFCKDINKVKAIVLGCDPTNDSKEVFEFAFGLQTNTKSDRYFNSIASNLEEVKLGKDEVYVQNLCQNYFKKTTADNLSIWKKAAKLWIPYLKEELDKFPSHIPVLLTSSYLYDVLVTGGKHKPQEYYLHPEMIPVSADNNLLIRPLIPFYRNRRKIDYHVSKWPEYRLRIIDIVHK